MIGILMSPTIPEITIDAPIRVALFVDSGVGESGIEHVEKVLKPFPSIHITRVSAEDISNGALDAHDVLICSGGAGHEQALTLHEAGLGAIRTFVENGGGYIGICAGAYLAVSGYDWSLKIINAKKVVADEWERGKGFVDIELTDEGRKVFGDVGGTFSCRYGNGIIVTNDEHSSLPSATPLAYFRTEVAENGTTKGAMINTPAIISAQYGKGKVMAVSPHIEDSVGLEYALPRAVVFVSS